MYQIFNIDVKRKVYCNCDFERRQLYEIRKLYLYVAW